MAECPLRGREGRQGLKPAASFLCIFDAFFLAYKLDGRFIDIPCRSSFFIYLLVPKCLSHPRLLYFLLPRMAFGTPFRLGSKRRFGSSSCNSHGICITFSLSRLSISLSPSAFPCLCSPIVCFDFDLFYFLPPSTFPLLVFPLLFWTPPSIHPTTPMALTCRCYLAHVM